MAKKRRKLTLAEGGGLSIIGLSAGVVSWLLASLETALLVRLLLLLFAWFTLWFFSHDLAHHIVGELVGIKFRYYYLGRSAIRKLKMPLIPGLMSRIPVLVLKIHQDSLLRVSARDQ